MAAVFLILELLLHVTGAIVCINKANHLHRSTGGWGFFGFVAPIIAVIWIQFKKPSIKKGEISTLNKKLIWIKF